MQHPRNPWLCVLIVGAFALTLLVGLVGFILLALAKIEPPIALVSLVSGAAGSLGTFLVMPRRGDVGAGESQAQVEQRHAPTAEAIPATRNPGP